MSDENYRAKQSRLRIDPQYSVHKMNIPIFAKKRAHFRGTIRMVVSSTEAKKPKIRSAPILIISWVESLGDLPRRAFRVDIGATESEERTGRD